MLGSDLRTHVADWKGEVVTAAGSIGHDVREVRFSDVAILDNVHEAVAGLDTAVFAGDGIAGHVSAANRYNEDTVENIYDQVVPIHVKRQFSIRSCSPAQQTSLVLAQFLAMRRYPRCRPGGTISRIRELDPSAAMTRSACIDVAALPLPTSFNINGRLAFNTSGIRYPLPVVKIALSPVQWWRAWAEIAHQSVGIGSKPIGNRAQLGISTGSDIVLFTRKFRFSCWAFSARIEFG
jgi:hypothetical protein